MASIPGSWRLSKNHDIRPPLSLPGGADASLRGGPLRLLRGDPGASFQAR
jgi:hypothetical protein